MELEIAEKEVEGEYVCSSNEALEFKLVRSIKDLEDDSVTFKPEMSHQIFGDNESIFGYKDLRVKMYYTASYLHMYLGMEYSSAVDPTTSGGVEPDNVLKMLKVKLQMPREISNIDEFVKLLDDEENFKPFGKLYSSCEIVRGGVCKVFDFYYCNTSDKNFLDFHERLQTFILFFIDAACYIDVDDPKWGFYVVYEKFKNDCGQTCHAVVGYSTVYEYYAYPDRIRPRISQMLVLPPFQRHGIAAHMLSIIYDFYRGQDAVVDITVEDPNEEFQRVRDYLDTSLCAKLDSFSRDKLRQGFSAEMATEACTKYKINKKQVRRIYEILRLKETNVHDDKEYSSYRLDIKRRLNVPFQKETTLIKKLKPLVDKDPKLLRSLGLKTPEQRFEALNQMFQETEEEYRKILARLEQLPLCDLLLNVSKC